MARARPRGAGRPFRLAYWILGNGYQMHPDDIGLLIGMIGADVLLGTALGLLMGTVFPITHLTLIFSIAITPLIFTGCLQDRHESCGGATPSWPTFNKPRVRFS